MPKSLLPAPSDKPPRSKLTMGQIKFAGYWAQQDPNPRRRDTKIVQCATATHFANLGRNPELPPLQVTYEQLITLKKRQDFQDLVNKIKEGGIEAARAAFIATLPGLIDYHQWGADTAFLEKDWKTMVHYTKPAIDAIMPKTLGLQQTNITITLSDKRQAMVNEPEAEMLEAELLPDEDTDGV